MRGIGQRAQPESRSELRDIVESVLARSTYFSGKNLRFEVHEDGVILRGVVRSYYQKQLAQDRQSVTCGACELVTRPKTAPAPKPEPVDLYIGSAVEPGAPAMAEAPAHVAEMPPV